MSDSVYDAAMQTVAQLNERIATLTAENERLKVQLEGTKQVRLRTEELVREVDGLNARVAALEALLDTASEYMRIEEAMRWTKDKQAALTPDAAPKESPDE